MNLLVFKHVNTLHSATRVFSCSSVLGLKQWRVNHGLPANRNAEGILTDGPDYTFLDGRPTPLLQKQKLRMQRQQEFASKIVELNSELAHAKDRHQRIQQEIEEERQRISGKLKPKGRNLFQKK